MAFPSAQRSPFERASFIRHLALCASALLAYVLRDDLHVGNAILWILALAGLMNLLASLFWDRPVVGVFVRRLSPLFGLGGWFGLMLLTGGATSPFAAGLWLEITLAAMTATTAGLAGVTAGSAAGLWLQQIPLGLAGVTTALAVQTGFLVVTAGLAGHLARRSKKTQDELAWRHAELRSRLRHLENEMQEARTMGQLGEHVARLAHGLTNTVHSLRGFLGLIEPRFSDSSRDRGILQGLHTAVDRLEEVARVALGGPVRIPAPESRVENEDLRRVVRDVAREVGLSFPGIRWRVTTEERLPEARTSPLVLQEVLTILVRNAAESMQGHGDLEVGARSDGRDVEVYVRDHGPGIPPENIGRVFEPGFTTKPDGHGFGLFLAHKVVESQGGRLRVVAAEGGGTLVSLALPVSGLPVEA